MQLIFIHGQAACGKYTVARLLAERTGLALFHNHLTVDLVATLFEFGSEPFVRLRERIWLETFREAAAAERSVVFTFQPEATVSPDFPARAATTVEALGGEVVFIALACSEAEIERRVEASSRAAFGKLRSLREYRRLRDAGAFDFPAMPTPALTLDTETLEPEESARRIAELVHTISAE